MGDCPSGLSVTTVSFMQEAETREDATSLALQVEAAAAHGHEKVEKTRNGVCAQPSDGAPCPRLDPGCLVPPLLQDTLMLFQAAAICCSSNRKLIRIVSQPQGHLIPCLGACPGGVPALQTPISPLPGHANHKCPWAACQTPPLRTSMLCTTPPNDMNPASVGRACPGHSQGFPAQLLPGSPDTHAIPTTEGRAERPCFMPSENSGGHLHAVEMHDCMVGAHFHRCFSECRANGGHRAVTASLGPAFREVETSMYRAGALVYLLIITQIPEHSITSKEKQPLPIPTSPQSLPATDLLPSRSQQFPQQGLWSAS